MPLNFFLFFSYLLFYSYVTVYNVTKYQSDVLITIRVLNSSTRAEYIQVDWWNWIKSWTFIATESFMPLAKQSSGTDCQKIIVTIKERKQENKYKACAWRVVRGAWSVERGAWRVAHGATKSNNQIRAVFSRNFSGCNIRFCCQFGMTFISIT